MRSPHLAPAAVHEMEMSVGKEVYTIAEGVPLQNRHVFEAYGPRFGDYIGYIIKIEGPR